MMKIKRLIEILDDFDIKLFNISDGNVIREVDILSKDKDFPHDLDILGVACDSQEVRDGFIFVGIKGVCVDGNKFIGEAIGKGAKVVLSQRPIDEIMAALGNNFSLFGSKNNPIERVIFVQVSDARKALARIAAEFYDNPSSKVKVVGVTGTNGKTTISYLIEAILKSARAHPAVIGTINCRYKNKVCASKNTTPGPVELQSMFAKMLKDGVDTIVMEVSSHALDQDRVGGVKFSSAIFTNLTQDHLDYHLNMENYFQAKLKLFKGIDSRGLVVLNNDDAYGRKISAFVSSRVFTYAIDNQSQVMAKDIKSGAKNTEFVLSVPGAQVKISTSLIGLHNVYNILAASAWGVSEGIDLAIIKSAVEKFNFVPGRLERVDCDRDFSVFVDYAHTEDALKNVISALRPLAKGRIIVVFGCGGERDKTKRPKMGRIVSELADYAIITNDNPRSEDPSAIIDDIKKGIIKGNFRVINDRKEAIQDSLSLAASGDIVLIAGKGHENYQILKDGKYDFDDAKVVKECLADMAHSR